MFLVKGMMIHDGNMSYEKFVQKYLRYQHPQNNYKDSIASGLMSLGWEINMSPAIETVTDDLELKWKNIWYNAERRLVELLLLETSKLVSKIETNIENKIRNLHPNGLEKPGCHCMKNFSPLRTL